MTNSTPIVQGIVSGSSAITSFSMWPSHVCIKEDEPDYFINVGLYAKDIWKMIREEGGHECQTEIEVEI